MTILTEDMSDGVSKLNTRFTFKCKIAQLNVNMHRCVTLHLLNIT